MGAFFAFGATSAWAATFELTTTELAAGDTFEFMISAQGTFEVDCGDGGTLSGTGVTPGTTTIDHTSNTTNYTYTCTYDTDGAKVIGFDGTAEAYAGTTGVAAISFYTSATNAAKVADISGNFSDIFPEESSSGYRCPRFYQTFMECTELREIPDTLFSGYTTGCHSKFRATFMNCTNLTEIPENLFSFDGNDVSGETRMFGETFKGDTSLSELPENLFAKITTAANQMFYETFYGCTGLTGYIPPTMFAGLIANGSPNANAMIYNTFASTGSLAHNCPVGTHTYNTGYESDFSGRVSCEKDSYACSSGQYLPANSTSCSACPGGYTCSGGTYFFNASADQGKTPNLISIIWDSNTNTSCTYGSTFNVPTPTARTGYVFTGWKRLQ